MVAAGAPFFLPATPANSNVKRYCRSSGIGEKASAVVRDELIGQPRKHSADAETAEIEVEVGMDRHEFANVDAGGGRSRNRSAA